MRKKCRRKRRHTRRFINPGENFGTVKRRVRASRAGRKVWRIAKGFWKVDPVALTSLPMPAGYKSQPVAFLGRAPAITVADGPEKKFTRKRRLILPKQSILVGDKTGRRMAVLNLRLGLPAKPQLKKLGYAAATEYMASEAITRAGSPKAKENGQKILWNHEHQEEGGTWPELWQDQNGNIGYGKSTLTFKGLWMRR